MSNMKVYKIAAISLCASIAGVVQGCCVMPDTRASVSERPALSLKSVATQLKTELRQINDDVAKLQYVDIEKQKNIALEKMRDGVSGTEADFFEEDARSSLLREMKNIFEYLSSKIEVFKSIAENFKKLLPPSISFEEAKTGALKFYQETLREFPEHWEKVQRIQIFEEEGEFTDSESLLHDPRSKKPIASKISERLCPALWCVQTNQEIRILDTEVSELIKLFKDRWLADPALMLTDFRVKIISGISLGSGTVVHEIGHVLGDHYGMKTSLDDPSKKGLNQNQESSSVLFEVLYNSVLGKTMRLLQICNHFEAFVHVMHDAFSSSNFDLYCVCTAYHYNPITLICQDEYITALYRAFKLRDRINSGEISVIQGLDEAVFGADPNLTIESLCELIDRLSE
ncbi:MAG: hypothetical protein K6C34_03210 [Alphaproteobacteria bacterium]|nr:hypothetical protein [Alphaproteobacteria bacterium]